jgi:hypothetical protein
VRMRTVLMKGAEQLRGELRGMGVE